MGNQLSQNAWQQPFAMNQSNSMMAASEPVFQAPNPMQTSQQLIGAMRPAAPMNVMQPQPPAVANPQASMVVRNNVLSNQAPVKKRNDLLDFDVFSDFRTPSTTSATNQQPVNNMDSVDGANQSALNSMRDASLVEAQSTTSLSNPFNTNQTPTFPKSNTSLLDTSFPSPVVAPVQREEEISQQSATTISVKAEAPASFQYQAQQPPAGQPQLSTPTPVASQENYAVPLESLKPSKVICVLYFDRIFHFDS